MSSPAFELDRLNQLSVSKSFTPETDLDWNAMSTDEELAALYPAWSLLAGSGLDANWGPAERVDFVKYQQMNLMLLTALLERYALPALIGLYDFDRSAAFAEYVGHFIKEELYHHTMFMRAVAVIQSSMPGRAPLPSAGVERAIRWLFGVLNAIPSRATRLALTFTVFRFAEQVTIFAHQTSHRLIPRQQSLINQVWRYHAIDEARHVAFDGMVIERCNTLLPIAWLATPFAAVMSMLLNRNELWAAAQLGVNIPLHRLPGLMRRTEAPFKRRVFKLLFDTLKGHRGEEGA